MMSSLVLISWLLLGLLRLPCTVKGHGAVVSLNNEGDATGSRNWRTHRGLVPGLSEWDPNSLLGTGGRVDEFDSACGEPGQTQHSEQYRDMRNNWLIPGDWVAGQEVDFQVRITANHGGIMEFRWACGDGKNTIEVEDFYDEDTAVSGESACFEKHPNGNFRNGKCLAPRVLQRVNKGETKNLWARYPNWYILSQQAACQERHNGGLFEMTYRMPQTQCSRIVVQWWWTTSNGCIPPTWRVDDFPCQANGWPNWGMTTCDPTAHTKSASGEQFVNCVDVPMSGGVAPQSPARPSPTPTPSPRPSPSVRVSPQPSPSARASPSPVAPGDAMVNRKVIYIGWDLFSSTNLMSDVQAVVDAGYTHINLAFWMPHWEADSVGVWAGMSVSQRQAVIAMAHAAGAKLLVSAGGATMDLETVMTEMTGTVFGQTVAQWAVDHQLDGVDFDLETTPGNSAPFRDGSLISWAVDATRAARDILGPNRIISHAPQAPYLGDWAGAQKGYVEIMRQTGAAIDFLNIQYYNQGAGVYSTYETLFKQSSSWWSSTAVKEIVDNGVDMNKLVVGKYFPGDGGSGAVTANTMVQFIQQAKAELGWRAGVMLWVWKASRPAPTLEWGAAISAGGQSPAPGPSPTPQPSPAPTPMPSPASTPQPSSAPTPMPSPASTPQPSPAPTPMPSPAATPNPTPSPVPSQFTVQTMSSSEWYVKLNIQPFAEAAAAIIVQDGTEFKMVRQTWEGGVFTLSPTSRITPDAAKQIIVVDSQGVEHAMTFAFLTAQGNSRRLLAQAPPASSQSQGMLRDAALVAIGGLMVAVVGVIANKRTRAPHPLMQGILLQPESTSVYWSAPDHLATGPKVLVPLSSEV